MVALADIVTAGQVSLDNIAFSDPLSAVLILRMAEDQGSDPSAALEMLRSAYLRTWSGADTVDVRGFPLPPALVYPAIGSSADTSPGSYDAGFDTPVATDPSMGWIASLASPGMDAPNSVNPVSGAIYGGFGFTSDALLLGEWSTPGTGKFDVSAGYLNSALTMDQCFVYTGGFPAFLAATGGASPPTPNLTLHDLPTPEPGILLRGAPSKSC
jgi:hypothetical protein